MKCLVILEARTAGRELRVLDAGGQTIWSCDADEADAPARLAGWLAGRSLEATGLELRADGQAVEVRLPRVGVICIGLARRAFDRLPAAARLCVAGGIDINGGEQTPLNADELAASVSQLMASQPLEAFAISGVNSGRNPVHEQQAAQRVRELTGLPVLEARFWGEGLDAGRRALEAARGTALLLALRPLEPLASAIRATLGPALQTRAVIQDPALLAAMVAARTPAFAGLIALAGGAAGAAVLQARVTRAESQYVCHCTDGVFAFDSVTAAKQFAERHLREQWAVLSAGLNRVADPVQIDMEDRYTFVRGRRGPVRVYLETIVAARTAT